MIRALHPKIAVMDIHLTGMNGQQVTHQVVQDKLSTRIILLTANDDHEQISHAAWAGAVAYCAKNNDSLQLVLIAKEVNDGKFVIENRVFENKRV